MLKLLLGTDWKSNRKAVLNMVAADVANEKSGIILMVPELVSHQTERDMLEIAGDKTCLFAEVLSFSRLASRVADEKGVQVAPCMDNGGRIVAMASATRQLHSRLKAYAAVQTKPEFLVSLLEIVDEFKRCCIQPRDLISASTKMEGALAQKIEELGYIFETYDAICQNGKRDPRDLMTWLLEQLEESTFAESHTFYFDAFPDFSRQHMDILCHLIDNSPDVIVSLNCDVPGSNLLAFEKAGETAKQILSYAKRAGIPYEIITIPANQSILTDVAGALFQGAIIPGFGSKFLNVYQTESLLDECEAVSEYITKCIHSGARYKDISIVCTDMSLYGNNIERAFRRSHIPVYISGKESLLDKNIIHTILTAVETALGGFSCKDVISYLRSFLCPVDIDMCDKVENYACMWSIDGSGWFQEWDKHPKGLDADWTDRDYDALKKLNDSRKRILEPLDAFRRAFRDANDLQQQIQSLYGFLKDIHLKSILQRLSERAQLDGDYRSSQIINQIWEIVLGALEQLHDTLSHTVWDADTFSRLLRLLLSQYDVGTIPALLDAVTVGSVSAMRCHHSEHVIIMGATEGAFPSYSTSSGILNDIERSELMKLGVPMNPGAIDGLKTQFSEIQEVISSAQRSIAVFYSGGQPSFVCKRLSEMAGGTENIKPQWGAALNDRLEAAAYLSYYDAKHQAEQLELTAEYDAVSKCKQHSMGAVSQSYIQELYGGKLSLSASQIDRLANCRMHYFLRYGLHAKENKAITVDPAEFGTYVHAVLEECGRTIASMGGFKKVSLEETLRIAKESSERYYEERFAQISSQRLSYHFQKNTKELEWIVKELWNEMQQSSFEAVDFELGFGEDEKLPAIQICDGDLSAQLGGFVDRVDLWRNNGDIFLRVIDYKTGAKEIDYCDIFNGIGLQMLLYLYALEENAESLYEGKPVISGVEYFPARVPFLLAEGALTQDEAEADRRKAFIREGLLLSEENVLYAMENTDEPVRLPYKRKADGTLVGNIASRNQFAKLKKYIFSYLKKMVLDVASGNITPNPYTRGSSHNACKYCPYGSICMRDEIRERRNYQAMKQDRFWEEVEKEV